MNFLKTIRRLTALNIFLIGLIIPQQVSAIKVDGVNNNTYKVGEIITLSLKTNPNRNDQNALSLRLQVINGDINNLILSSNKEWLIVTKDCPNSSYNTINNVCLSIAKANAFKVGEDIAILSIKKTSEKAVTVLKEDKNGYAGKDFTQDSGILFKEKVISNLTLTNTTNPITSYPISSSQDPSISVIILILALITIFALIIIIKSKRISNTKLKQIKNIGIVIFLSALFIAVIILGSNLNKNQSLKDNKADLSCICCNGEKYDSSLDCPTICHNRNSGIKSATNTCNSQGISVYQCIHVGGSANEQWNKDSSSNPICCDSSYVYSYTYAVCVKKGSEEQFCTKVGDCINSKLCVNSDVYQGMITNTGSSCSSSGSNNSPNCITEGSQGPVNNLCCNTNDHRNSVGGGNLTQCVAPSPGSSTTGGTGTSCSGAHDCSVSCNDNTHSFSDPCPASGAFASCQLWSEEACRPYGGAKNSNGGTTTNSGGATTNTTSGGGNGGTTNTTGGGGNSGNTSTTGGGNNGGGTNSTTGGDSGGGTPPNNGSKKPICGDTCNSDSDCTRSTFGFNTKCINKVCANPGCPADTDPGTLCGCKTASNKCGDKCGVWDDGFQPLCGDGHSTCTKTGTAPGNKNNTYCVPDSVLNSSNVNSNLNLTPLTKTSNQQIANSTPIIASTIPALCLSVNNTTTPTTPTPTTTTTQITCYSCSGSSTNACQSFSVEATTCPTNSSATAEDCLSKASGSCSNTNTVDCGPIDSNGDSKLTILDLNDFAAVYGKTCRDHYTQTQGCGGKDYYNEGTVNIRDLAYFTSKYGKDSCN